MTKWLLKSGKGDLLPREVFLTPDKKFRRGLPGLYPATAPRPSRPKPPPHNQPYRDAKGRLLKGHPYAWQPGAPRPKAHQRPPTTIIPRDKYGRFASPTRPPKPTIIRGWYRITPP